jgi:YidC/Oxa1 family membrane protein insertase
MTMTDNIRVFLWVALATLVWLTFDAWQRDYPATPAPEPTAAAPAAPLAAPLPTLPGAPAASAAAPGTSAVPQSAVPPLEGAVPSAVPGTPAANPGYIRVLTDVLDVRIALAGGDLQQAALPGYPINKKDPDRPIQLLSPEADRYFVFQTGLRGVTEGAPEPNHLATFTAGAEEYTLGAGSEELLVPLTWEGGDGVKVTKTYRFRRGSYHIDLDYAVRNESEVPYQAASYVQLDRLHQPPEQSMFDVDTYSFTGPVAYDGTKYQKLDVEDLAEAPFRQTVAGGWVAAIQHHFLAAAVPAGDQTYNYEGRAAGGRFQMSAIGPVQTIAPGTEGTFKEQLFVGPKLQEQLEETAPGLELTADYGKLTLLSKPLFWLLNQVYQLVGNWGWTIIIVTLMIKAAFYKLAETSGRSMARMRKLQPRMQALQERYKEDRAALSQAMMDLYKKEKINPAAGCLPMLVQIPFFIAFYWVLLESVEMRQAPFMLWINDLSSRDPFFVLPLLMGAAMYFQQKMNPAPPDPVQAKIMQFMPIMFTGMFAFFPAGLVLYWLTNSLVSMLQQWRINKVLGAE